MRVSQQTLLDQVKNTYIDLQFETADEFLYDAADEIIYYDPESLENHDGQVALLHEIAHAELGHFHFTSDLELFALETQAWNKTASLCEVYAVPLSENYLQSCLQTYATWLTQRATCPACDNFSTQENALTYRCFLCHTRWQVKTDAQSRIKRVRLS